MVCSIVLTVLHSNTLLVIGCEISTVNQNPTNKWLLMATQNSKTEHTIWKSNETWPENWFQIFCDILFDLIYSMTSSDSYNANIGLVLIQYIRCSGLQQVNYF